MTDSVFFRFVARIMSPILIMFSVFLLLRGHNSPGGGFVGGLVAATSVILLTLAYNPDEVRRRLRIDFLRVMYFGLVLAATAGILGLILGGSFLQSLFWSPLIRGVGRLELSTPLLFDIGVYVVVVSERKQIVMAMAEEGED